jgi:capsular exopolysaccharide synthesis family protein
MENQFKFIQNPKEHISDIKDYIFRVLANWKWFVLSIVIALGIAYYYNISAPKLYGLSSTIAIKEKQNPLFSTGTNIAFNWGGVSDKVESIRKALTSRSHNEKVIKRLNFHIDYLQEGQFRNEDVYGKTPFKFILQPNQYQLLNTLIKIDFIEEDTFTISVDFGEKTSCNLINYKDETQKNIPVTNPIISKTYTVDEYINLPFLKAQVLRTDSINSIKGSSYFVKLNSVNQITSRYQNVRASGLSGTSLIQLSLTGANKSRIVDYLNTTIQVLAEDELEHKTNYARNTKAFIDAQFKNTSDSLKVIEANIGKFKKENDIYDLSAQGGLIFSRTTGLDEMQKQLTDRIVYFENLENYIESTSNFEKIPAPAIINIEDGSIASMMGELTRLSIEKNKLTTEVTANHPSLKLKNDEIETVRGVLLENLSSLKNTTLISLNNSKKRLNSYNYELDKLPNKEQKLLNFERKYSLTESNFVFLMQKRYEADIAIAASVSDITVLDSAKDTGQGAILPRIQFNYMVALLLGIILPLFVIVAIEIFDNKINTVEDIERVSPIPILGVVGRSNAENNLAVFLKPKSSVAESIRSLRSNIQFLFHREAKNKSKTILVTSSVSGEGKTFLSINIASVFALAGKKTILVGLDLRKPKIVEHFDMKNEKGVVNYLIGEKNSSEIIHKTKIENLDVIPSGPTPPNPSELLMSNDMDELLKQLKDDYEYIILDTPPIGLVSDAIELLKYADATIYVVRQNYSEKRLLNLINDKYSKEEITNVSIVLNDFKVKTKYGYGYGYGKYSNAYHENDKQSWIKNMIKKIKKS